MTYCNRWWERCRSGVALSLVWVLLGTALAAEEEREQADSSTSGERWLSVLVQQLGADDFATRRKAFFEIWNVGAPALPAVKQGKQSSNLQIAQVATTLEPLLALELTVDELGSDVYQLLMNPSLNSVLTLCERGSWELAMRLVHDNEALRSTAVSRSFVLSQLVALAVEQGEPTRAWPLVRALARPDADEWDGSDVSLWIATTLDLEFEPETEDERALALLYAGEVDAALACDCSPEVRRKILTRHACWPALKEPQNGELILGARGGLAHLAASAALMDYAGDASAASDIWKQLLEVELPDQAAEELGTASPSAALAARLVAALDDRQRAALQLLRDAPGFESSQLMFALLTAGHAPAIEAYLLETNSKSSLGFMISSNNYGGVLEYVGLEKDLSNFETWLGRQRPALEAEARQQMLDGEAFDRLSRVCNLLVTLGYHGQAEQLLDQLMEIADDKASLWSSAILRYMSRSEQRSLTLKVLPRHLSTLRTETRHTVLRSLFPELSRSADLLLSTAPVMPMADEPPHPLELLDRLHAWDETYFASQGASIVDWLVRAERRLLASESAKQSMTQYVVQLSELIKVARGAGFDDLAASFAATDASGHNASAEVLQLQWLAAAEMAVEQGRLEEAADRLEQFRKAAPSYSYPTSTLLEEKVLLLLGKYDAALLLNQARWLRPLATSRYGQGTSYASVADELSDVHDYAAAEVYAEVAFELSGFSEVDTYFAAYDLATIHEEKDELEASANVLRAPLVEGLLPASPMVGYHVQSGGFHYLRYAIQKERLHRAATLIDQGDYAAAQHHIQVGMRLQPQDIEMVVECYPRLVEAGQEQAAEKLFDTFDATMQQQIAEWPRDATTLNNLAWMYAKTQRKLDKALALAQQAVQLAPHSAVYLDTLAEVHFRAGRIAEAEAAMQQCIRMDPRDPHYRDNLKRFRDN